MPTYEYLCKKCGDNFDVHQSFTDKPLKKHKACGGDLQKVFHASGIVFRGDGFYATDSKGSTQTESKPAESDNDKGKPSADSKKKETSSKNSKRSDQPKKLEAKAGSSKSGD